eukprot:13567199-Alexandrium_andersonii.AAC.1
MTPNPADEALQGGGNLRPLLGLRSSRSEHWKQRVRFAVVPVESQPWQIWATLPHALPGSSRSQLAR